MKRFSGLFLFSVMVLVAASASAEGWYVGAFGSFSGVDDIRFDTALGTVTTPFESDMGLGLVVGYDFDSVRVEGEWSMREYEVENHILGGARLPGPTGDSESRALMVNAYYDFNQEGTVQPYIGAGLGLVDVELDGFGVTPVPDVLSDDDSGFGYQLMLGLGFEVSESWTLFIDYRYQSADDLSVTVSPAAGAVSSDIDWTTQDVALGVRYSF